ncbi:MAG TPA: hypothetical protein VK875_01105 [Euzebyales bacterium]|nr:hypothetical protein [Euzebyales bacterium]
MRGGGLGWFLAGIAACLLVINDRVGDGFDMVTVALAGVTTFVVTLLTALGPVLGAIVVLGVGLVIGSLRAERARGRKDADDAWNKRSAYRR